ncbi:hypothetical protein DPMN_057472 [Dreissena polymorpha]|uniref:Uncharacterized protein n=1 Tax=Dreissena polymorpha TaxID=45954 RepID=A0A9D4C095_DREPO|nr:hypothetical protein DPMN_057472 [Dreissena polymorpha]
MGDSEVPPHSWRLQWLTKPLYLLPLLGHPDLLALRDSGPSSREDVRLEGDGWISRAARRSSPSDNKICG